MRTSLVFIILCMFLVGGRAAAQEEPSSEEKQLVQLINQERARRGLGALAVDDRLTRAAREHTRLMIGKNTLSHRLPDEPDLSHRVAATNLPFDASGENVAYNSDVRSAHKAFMESPGHRANILKPEFNAMGVGIERQGDRMWVTEDFARKLKVTSAARAAEIVAQRLEEVRAKGGLTTMTGIAKPELAAAACEMAHKDRLGAEEARRIPAVRSVVEWTTADPNALPPEAQRVARESRFRKYSLGTCYAPSESHPSPVFWVVLVLY